MQARSERVQVLVDKETLSRVDAMCKALGWSRSRVMAQLVVDGLELAYPIVMASVVVRGWVHSVGSIFGGIRKEKGGQGDLFSGLED